MVASNLIFALLLRLSPYPLLFLTSRHLLHALLTISIFANTFITIEIVADANSSLPWSPWDHLPVFFELRVSVLSCFSDSAADTGQRTSFSFLFFRRRERGEEHNYEWRLILN